MDNAFGRNLIIVYRMLSGTYRSLMHLQSYFLHITQTITRSFSIVANPEVIKPPCSIFQATWLAHLGYQDIVALAWKKPNMNVVNCLSNVKEDSLVFNRETFRNIFRKKRQLEARIKGV